MATCYRHPNRETGVSCSNCGNPICPDCMTPTPVGMRCPDCAQPEDAHGDAAVDGRRADRDLRPGRDQRPDLLRGVRAAPRPTSSWCSGGRSSTEGEYWRLITVGFLHTETWHIVLNGLALFWLGRMIEPALGHARFVAIYFASLLCGSLGVMILSPDTPTLGASGAVYGLLGAAIVMARNRNIDLIQSGPGADPRAQPRPDDRALVEPLARRAHRRPDRRPGRDVRRRGARAAPAQLAGPGHRRLRGDRRRGRRGERRCSPRRRSTRAYCTPPGGSGTRSGCSAWPSHSRPSTSRGPGRENQAAASATTIRLRAERAELLARSRAPPRARARRRSRTARRPRPPAARPRPPPTCAARTARPGGRAGPSPPAYSISCGTQWPPTKTGSSHSSNTTRDRRRLARATPDAVDRARRRPARGPRPRPCGRWPGRACGRRRAPRRACAGPGRRSPAPGPSARRSRARRRRRPRRRCTAPG